VGRGANKTTSFGFNIMPICAGFLTASEDNIWAIISHFKSQFRRKDNGDKSLTFSFQPFSAVSLIACKANQPAAATANGLTIETAPPDCDRVRLEGFANRYLDALTAHDP
jgi:hypothetical protein